MEDCLKYMEGKVLCRDAVVKQLYSLIGTPGEPMPQSIFVHGHISTGKTLVVESLLAYLKYNVSIVNCIEHPNGKHVFDYISTDLSSHSIDSLPTKTMQKCENVMNLITNMKEICKKDSRPIVIVFDKCEKLRNTDLTLLAAFLRLNELSGVNVCTILISDIAWEKFRAKIGVYEPIKIHFPQYTRDEFGHLLFSYKPHRCDDAFYKNYLNLFLSVFFRFCRDLNELRYMAKVNFSKYIEPVKEGRCDKDDVATLWRNISPVFKANLEVIYLRVSADDLTKRSQLSKEIESTTRFALSFELPYYAKYMLIAAYLASYNPAKEDKRLFMKQKNRRGRKTVRKPKLVTANIRVGPHNFPISRMLAIFCAILDEKVDINANLLAQIPSMCQLGLITPVGNNNLDEPKFRCCVCYDFIVVIAKTVGFNIQKYLYDFTQ